MTAGWVRENSDMSRAGMTTAAARASRLLGPLEARIMQRAWSGAMSDRFTVRDMQQKMPALAYTTVMTTLSRLAAKELLEVVEGEASRAYVYRIRMTPEKFLAASSRNEVERFVDRFGDAALVAFAARLDKLSPARRERLRKLGGR